MDRVSSSGILAQILYNKVSLIYLIVLEFPQFSKLKNFKVFNF